MAVWDIKMTVLKKKKTNQISKPRFLCRDDNPVHRKMFSNICSLYPPDASRLSFSCVNQECLQAQPDIPCLESKTSSI